MLFKLKTKYQAMPRIVRASLWFVICSFMQKGISVLTTPIFTRLMNTEEYGRYSVFSSWYSIAEVFISLEIAKGVYSQAIVKFSEEKNLLSSSLHGLNCALALAWTGIYLLFAEKWNNLLGLTTVQMLCMIAMIWATAAFELWATEQRTDCNYKPLCILTIATSLFKPLLGIILVINAQDKATARIIGLTAVEIIAYSGLCIYQMLRGKKAFSKKYWLYALSFNIPLIPHYLSQVILESSDRIMINNIVNESAVGLYSLAYSVAMIMRLLNGALNQTISPWLYKRIKYNETNLIAPVSEIALAIVAVGNLALIAIAPEAILVFAPATYYEAIWVVPPVTMSVFFLYMYNYFGCIEFYFEEKRYISIATIVEAILNIILNAIFIPKFGYIAAAYTTLVCNIMYAAAHYCFMRMACKKHLKGIHIYNERHILYLSGIMLSTGFILTILYPYRILRYIMIALAGVVLIYKRKKWYPMLKTKFKAIKE